MSSSVMPSLMRQQSTVLEAQTVPIESKYKLLHKIGQPGQFGYAMVCQCLETGEKRAVKILSKAKFSRANERKIYFEELRNELEVMQKVDHPNIIKLYDVFETPSELYIVMELCQGGELFDRIKSQENGAYSEKDASSILKQILEGLKYLHSRRIMHCDLKPDNFLFVSNAADSALKIIDFGMAKSVKTRQFFSALRGTAYYISPDVLSGHYNESADLWSFGVVMFVMLYGFPPFFGDSDDDIFKAVRRGFEPKTKRGYGAFFPADIPCSDSAKDLIGKLLVMDPSKRLTAAEALEHPFFFGGASATPLASLVFDKLKSFTGMSKLKQNMLQIMSSSLSDDEVRSLRKVFQELDENGDGQITVAELESALKRGVFARSALSFDDLLKMIEAVDVDGDGSLSWKELMMAIVNTKIGAKEERLWNAFCKIDLDGNGMISADEIQQVMGVSIEEAREMIREVDVDASGCIDFNEFITMWSGLEAKKFE